MHPQGEQCPFVQAALDYANRGWRVFALAPRSKEPRRGSHGFLDATTETDTIRQWWEENPRYNVGIATGNPSGLVVLDIDLRHGGDASLYELERHFGVLPETPMVNTSGGWHLYFRHPGENLAKTLGDDYPGLDIQSDGAYIVAPPSIHPDGAEYSWKLGPEEVESARLPDQWVTRLRALPRSLPPACEEREARAEAKTYPEGTRHNALLRLAGRLVNAGLGSVEQLRGALAAFNAEQCDPPLPECEVTRLAESTAHWERRPVEDEPTEAAARRERGPLPARERNIYARVRARDRRREVQLDEDEIINGRSWISCLELEQMVCSTSWLWPGWVADDYISVVAGESGSGKSWLALALARCVINAWPWPDGQPNEEGPGVVFWVEAEGRSAVVAARARDLEVDLTGLRFMTKHEQIRYLDWPEDLAKVAYRVEELRPRVMVVDAWSKSLAGSENDADVRFCLDDLQTLAREYHMPIVLVHHLRKKQLTDYAEGFDFDRLRGSSVLSQVATCVIGVDQPTPGTPNCRVSCGKANLAPLPEPCGFSVTGGFKTGLPASLTFGPPPEKTEPGSRLDEAKAFLRPRRRATAGE